MLKSFKVPFIFLLLVTGCGSSAQEMPLYDSMKKGYADKQKHINAFYEKVRGQKGDLLLQLHNGVLTYKVKKKDPWKSYEGGDAEEYKGYLLGAQVRFAGVSDDRVYLGGFSHMKNGRLYVIDIEKHLGEISHSNCDTDLLSRSNGVCDAAIEHGWYVHYFWSSLNN